MAPESTVEVIASINVIIDAPAQFVWDIMMDVARYGEWNPYTVRVETSFEIGSPVDLWVPYPDKPDELWQIREFMVLKEAPNQLAYQRALAPDGSRDGRRDQYVTELGPERCSYFTVDLFIGVGMTALVQKYGAWVKKGFDDTALALKARAEKLYKESRVAA